MAPGQRVRRAGPVLGTTTMIGRITALSLSELSDCAVTPITYRTVTSPAGDWLVPVGNVVKM